MPRKEVALTDSYPDFCGRAIDDGRLLLIDFLGKGAYGKVYRALDTTSPMHKRAYYAVKCLKQPEVGSREDIFQRREFLIHQKMSRYNHTNIVGFHNVLFEDIWVFVVLDLCDGSDLFGAITAQNAFKDNDQLVKSVFIQIVDAVQTCHDQGIFHRDIKPENILMNSDNTHSRLADFGLATDAKISTDFGCGSFFYMSPECIGKEMGRRPYSSKQSDIWALGVLLVNMISGHNPWRKAVTTDDCFSCFLADQNFLRTIIPISADVNSVLKKIFRVDPKDRISLPQLREEILGLRSFFGKLVQPPKIYHKGKLSAEEKAWRILAERPAYVEDSSALEASSGDFDGNSPLPSQSGAELEPVSSTHSHTIHRVAFHSDSTSDSDPSSPGPITPARHAAEPAIEVEVPELLAEDGVGYRLISTPHELPAKGSSLKFDSPVTRMEPLNRPPRRRAPSTAPLAKPSPKRTSQLLNRARRFLRALSGSNSTS